MKKDIKHYNIMLSQAFPVGHPKAGKPTDFVSAFNNAQMCARCREKRTAMCMGECVIGYLKRHTIRANYELWRRRIEAVERGEAVINIRVWNGKPYRSKTTLIATLTAQDGVGIQRLEFPRQNLGSAVIDYRLRMVADRPITTTTDIRTLAKNDGLSYTNWRAWFSGYDLSQPLAIIHFTKFRY